ncbi:hypothetical protein AAFF_G00108210 [Aldrovandia affinis]|uniref:C1q domain-containing protein n=1 Tax=Aldrovandia affinis TaxID=143900 RepID=A0AAD7WAT1_9TELE|nr:hypothetical protein AAFF_G00108210 [Aldrovandia affinis]
MPQTSAGIVPERVYPESQNRWVSLLAACAGIITLASIISVVTLYLIMRLGIQTEVKDLVGHSSIYKGPLQVAFAASLRKSEQTTLGPYPEFHILVYKNIFTNIGGAYNTSTGIFTVPVRGVYHFTFNAFGWGEKVACGVLLHLNHRYLIGNYDNNPGPGRAATNMISLELDVGNVVYLGLSPGRRLHVSRENYNIFSGRLLFHT